MSRFWSRLVPFGCAALSAMLLFAAFPAGIGQPGLHALAWVGLAPLFFALRTGRGSVLEWLGVGWIFGLVYYGLQFSWMRHALVVQGGMSLIPFMGLYTSLVGMMALAPGVAMAMARGVLSPGASGRLRWPPETLLPLLWALQDHLFGIFPLGGLGWGSLAASQPHTWAARLIVPLGGGAGLVAVMALVNALWALALKGWWEGLITPRSPRGVGVAAGLLLMTLVLAWPAPPHSPAGPLSSGSPGETGMLPVVLVQGDRSIAELEADRDTPNTLRYYLGRTMTATIPPLKGGMGLVIWPESAVSGDAARGETLATLSGIAELLEYDLMLGSTTPLNGRDRNALFRVGPGGTGTQRYDKRRLVPFGEYVPFGFRWLFPRKITSGIQDYVPGTGAPVFKLAGKRLREGNGPPGVDVVLGVAICFESILPGHMRLAAREGAQAILVAANDAWLPDWAVEIHIALTALQGLATGLDTAFVANGGPALLLRQGRIVAIATAGEPPLTTELRLRGGTTPWVRHGDIPALGVALLLAILGGAAAFLLPLFRQSNPG